MKGLGLHVIQTPKGRWTFVGTVPASLAYIGEPAEIEKAYRFGAGFAKVKAVAFDTREDAIAFATSHGFTVTD